MYNIVCCNLLYESEDVNKATANFIFLHISEIHNYTCIYMYMYIVYSGTHGCNTGESVYVYNVQSLFSQVYTVHVHVHIGGK